jgi:hypothetical protein
MYVSNDTVTVKEMNKDALSAMNDYLSKKITSALS